MGKNNVNVDGQREVLEASVPRERKEIARYGEPEGTNRKRGRSEDRWGKRCSVNQAKTSK